MAEERFYLKFSKEMNKLIAKSGVDIEARLGEELKKSGRSIDLTYGRVPGSKEDRDVVLLLLAAGLTTNLVSIAVSRVITAIAGAKQAKMKEIHLKPAVDGNGQAIRDAKGQPVFETIEKPGVQELTQPASTTKGIFAKVLEFELTTGKPGGSKPEKGSAAKAPAAKKKTTKSAQKKP
jgi:hypothetical protein